MSDQIRIYRWSSHPRMCDRYNQKVFSQVWKDELSKIHQFHRSESIFWVGLEVIELILSWGIMSLFFSSPQIWRPSLFLSDSRGEDDPLWPEIQALIIYVVCTKSASLRLGSWCITSGQKKTPLTQRLSLSLPSRTLHPLSSYFCF